MELFIFDRPELSISSLNIQNANPDLSNQINAILQLSFPINPLKININYLQEIINDLEPVDFSKIRITENGVLEIFISERVPAVIHRYERQLMLLDVNGRRIGEVFSRSDRQDLPLVVGLDANLRVLEALEIYKSSASILNRIRGIILVGKRRWDIVLDSGQRIKLPEEEPKIALISFLRSDRGKKILNGHVSNIDLRFKGQIILRKRLLVSNEEGI
ncbi:MAG: cell division protein FtsQ/DivIB [Paracoccaceae bacterium]